MMPVARVIPLEPAMERWPTFDLSPLVPALFFCSMLIPTSWLTLVRTAWWGLNRPLVSRRLWTKASPLSTVREMTLRRDRFLKRVSGRTRGRNLGREGSSSPAGLLSTPSFETSLEDIVL